MVKIFLDMDEVIVDFVRPALKLHKLNIPYTNVSWDIRSHSDLSAPDFWNKFDKDFYTNLPWLSNGKALLNFLIGLVGAENICLCTAPILTSGCIEGKMNWIRRELPGFDRRFMITPVKHFCAGSNKILIDDKEKNCQSFIQHGGKAILVPAPWNSETGKYEDTGEYILDILSRRIERTVKLLTLNT